MYIKLTLFGCLKKIFNKLGELRLNFLTPKEEAHKLVLPSHFLYLPVVHF